MVKKILGSFPHAIRGIMICLIFEHNMKFHVFVSLIIIVLGYVFNLSREEWIATLACIGVVLCAEIINTAIEDLCDVVRDNLNLDYQKTKDARDLAAGAVLIVSFISLVIGIMIFGPKFVALFY